jgi:hypothetical protein
MNQDTPINWYTGQHLFSPRFEYEQNQAYQQVKCCFTYKSISSFSSWVCCETGYSWYSTTVRPIAPAPDNGGTVGRLIGRGNTSIRTKPAPVALCPPQIHMTWLGLEPRAAAMGRRWLAAWATVRPWCTITELTLILSSTLYVHA